MPRAGSVKVKTGCFTCKTRKIKCDETRPHCQRCLVANRPCTGYPEVRGQAQYSWAHLFAASPSRSSSSPSSSSSSASSQQLELSPPPLPRPQRPLPTSVISAGEQDARALAFFRACVAPALSRHSSTPFWTVRVSQVAAAEPAVHHALAAISALYEGLAAPPAAAAALERPRARFAISHYNRALGHLKDPHTDRNTVLLVCLLFICIEAMQGDKHMAIAHCRHGILICNAMPEGGLRGWAREELRPIFLRLATFPYFFGMEAGEFPAPVGLVADEEGEDGGWDRSSTAWDALVNRTVRVVRQGLSHRQGPLRDSPVPETLVQSQRQTRAGMMAWREHYRAQRSTSALTDEELEAHMYREMESIAGLIWVSCCLEASELGYDAYTADFADLLALSQQLIDRRSKESELRPIFSLEMGFTPFLYFVVMKCRRLELRVRALRHMLRLGYDRENLFNTRVLYRVGLRWVELEHGVRLDPAWPECTETADEPMPGDEMRVRTADITEEKEVRVGAGGQMEEYTKVYFLLRPQAIVSGHMEWVKAQPFSSGRPESHLDRESGF